MSSPQCRDAEFGDAEKIGIKFKKDVMPLTVRSVTAGGFTEAHFKWIEPGTEMLRVNESEIGAISYADAMLMVKDAARPRTLGFAYGFGYDTASPVAAPEQAAPEPQAALRTPAKAMCAPRPSPSLLSRSAPQQRQSGATLLTTQQAMFATGVAAGQREAAAAVEARACVAPPMTAVESLSREALVAMADDIACTHPGKLMTLVFMVDDVRRLNEKLRAAHEHTRSLAVRLQKQVDTARAAEDEMRQRQKTDADELRKAEEVGMVVSTSKLRWRKTAQILVVALGAVACRLYTMYGSCGGAN